MTKIDYTPDAHVLVGIDISKHRHEFALNNTHTIDFTMKRCIFSRHDLQGFV